jgi:ABC-type polysaccharide/polyol phosphate export permease
MIMDTKEVLQFLPKRINKIMGSLASNELIIHVNAIDEQYLMMGIQKIANRLTVGLILAAVIIGAALMMSVETEYRLFGYPGLAIIFFFLAVLGGVILAISIVYHDERLRKKSEGPKI